MRVLNRFAWLFVLVLASFLAVSGPPAPAHSDSPTRVFVPAAIKSADPGGQPLVDPPVLASAHGGLEVTLTATVLTTTLAGQPAQLHVFNGAYVAPTLRVRPGDVLLVTLNNQMNEPTNLHFHGLAVSPLGNGDNIFLSVPPGGSTVYRIEIPADHPGGLFWYHSHEHMVSANQVKTGLGGAIIIEGLLDSAPELAGIAERTLLLRDAPRSSATAPLIRLINGQSNPSFDLRPGESQLWRIGNTGADVYYRLQLDGHAMYEVARDGHRHPAPIRRDDVVLPPGSRVEMLVQGGAAGTYRFRTLFFSTGAASEQYPEAALATVVVRGEPAVQRPLPAVLPTEPDLRTVSIANQRTISFRQNNSRTSFNINGKVFDAGRVDTVVTAGTYEEWTIRNETPELHLFHIHQTAFQVLSINGQAQPFTGWQDTVDVPILGSVVVRIPFTGASIVGRFVYHCHILTHEDLGMMAVIDVVPEGGDAQELSISAGEATGAMHFAMPAFGEPETMSFDVASAESYFCPLPTP